MPDLWGPFRRSHKPPSESNEDALAEDLEALNISGDKARVGGKLHKKNGRDPATAARNVAALTVGGDTRPCAVPPISHNVSDRPWVGGFQTASRPTPPVDYNGRAQYTSSAPPLSFPTPHAYPSQPPGSLPTPPSLPMQMPIPIHEDAPISLTLQLAMLGPIDSGSNTPSNSQYQSGLRPPIAAVPPRPHSDPMAPHAYSTNTTPVSAPLAGPATPPRRRHDVLSQPPQSVPSKLTKTNLDALNTATPNRRRAASTPPSPAAGSAAGSSTPGVSVQCSGRTKAGARCKNMVKMQPALARLDPDVDGEIERFCHIHTAEMLRPQGTYLRSEYVEFDKYIPPYLQSSTMASLRTAMLQPPSNADKNGYIYTFEIRGTNHIPYFTLPSQTPFYPDTNNTTHVQLKVGRAVKLNKRIDEWSKQCGSKEQVLRGWWPGHQDENVSLLKGTVDPGLPGPLHHKLERLVHLELADLALHAPYLEPGWPHLNAPPTPNQSVIMKTSCLDCGAMHREIFTFRRMKGKNKGREYDLLVKPVIEKWGKYLREFFEQSQN